MTKTITWLLLALGALSTTQLEARERTSGERAPDAAAASAPLAGASCPALLRQTMPRLQDDAPQDLCQYAGQVLLVVNTASFCGFTEQYRGLESLQQRYGSRGFSVLGFPSNDFGRQEPGSNREIAEFCVNTFGVRFPMFAKSRVVGGGANPLFVSLAAQTGIAPGWNFHKYLVARDGRVIASFPSSVEPLDRRLLADIEKQLQR